MEKVKIILVYRNRRIYDNLLMQLSQRETPINVRNYSRESEVEFENYDLFAINSVNADRLRGLRADILFLEDTRYYGDTDILDVIHPIIANQRIPVEAIWLD